MCECLCKCINKLERSTRFDLLSNSYIFGMVYTINFLCSTLHTFLYMKIFCGVLHKHGADNTRSGISWGSKTATSSGRSIQMASNSVCMQRGPVVIDLFCLLIFTSSVTELQLCKVIAHFPAQFEHLSQ